jgi:hypothetical protein
MVELWVALAALVVVFALHRGHGVKAIVALAFVVGLYYGSAGWAHGVTHTVAATWSGINAALSKL